MVVVAIIFNLLAPIIAQSWAQSPFLGMFFFPNLIVSDSYSPAWPARAQGLDTGHRLLNVDGAPASSGRELSLLLRNRQPGQTVSAAFESPALQTADYSLTLLRFSFQDLLLFFWLPYSIGIIFLLLGLFVYRMRGLDHAGDVFVAFCVFASILTGGLFDLHTFHLLTPVWAVFFPLAGAALLHLALVFPAQSRFSRRNRWARLIPYLVAAALAAANLYSIYLSANPRAFLAVRLWDFGLIGLSIPLFLLLQLHNRYAILSTPVQRQSTIIFWGGVVAFGPAAVWAAATLLGFDTSFTGLMLAAVIVPFVIFPVTVAYAMLRYRLLDLDQLFNRGVVYTILTLMVTAIYFVSVSLVGHLLQDTFLFRNPIVLAIFVLILVISIEPLKQRLQTLINRLFLRESLDYQQLAQQYGRALIAAPLNTDGILELLVTQATNAHAPEHALVFLRNSNQGVFDIRYPQTNGSLQNVEVRFGLSDDLATWLADTKKILQLSPTGATPQGVRISREELARLNMLDITLCVPLPGSEHLLGWLALGLKKSGQPYSSSDFTFLETLASQTTIALENAQLLEEANRRAAELETLQKISVDIQAQANLEALLYFVVEQAAKLLRAEGGLVFMLEPDEKWLNVMVSHHLDKDYCGARLQIPQDVAGRVTALGQSVVVDNYQNFSGKSETFKTAQFGSVMGVPLRWSDKVRGVLVLVHRPKGLRFSESDTWLM
ncbi:MAG: GAF domain-containing protein, partial [Chloroflexi bacterium]